MVEGEQEVLVKQQSIRTGSDRRRDLGSESEEGFESGEGVDAHSQVNDGEAGVRGQVHGLALGALRHLKSPLCGNDKPVEKLYRSLPAKMPLKSVTEVLLRAT